MRTALSATISTAWALKSLKRYEQAASEFKKASTWTMDSSMPCTNCGMTYAEWYEESHASEQKQQARDYLQKFVATGGGKDGSRLVSCGLRAISSMP